MTARRKRRSLRERVLRPLDVLVDVARDWLERFVAVQGIDRAMAIGAQAYTALIPLLIVYSALLPRNGNRSFADALVNRFDLTGASAAGVRQAFAPSGTVESSVTGLGIVLLLVSALAFTRGLARLYEGAFDVPARGVRNTASGLQWIALVCVVAVVRPLVLGNASGLLEAIGSLCFGAALWLATPFLLLGRRIPWRRLVPVAALTSAGLTAVGVWSAVWMPHTLASSARQFGIIGIGFALLTWLVAVSVVLVAAATGGAMFADRLLGPRAPDATPEPE